MTAAAEAPPDGTTAPVAVAAGLTRTYGISRGFFAKRAILRLR